MRVYTGPGHHPKSTGLVDQLPVALEALEANRGFTRYSGTAAGSPGEPTEVNQVDRSTTGGPGTPGSQQGVYRVSRDRERCRGSPGNQWRSTGLVDQLPVALAAMAAPEANRNFTR